MTDGFTQRVQDRARLFEAAARERGFLVTADARVSEADAARLLGVDETMLVNWRTVNHCGPDWIVVGRRATYDVVDLARFVENRRRPQ